MRLLKISALLSCLFATPISAQEMQCGANYQEQVEFLNSEWGETRQGMGLASNNIIFELYFNDATSTFTFLIVRPDGSFCIPIAGEGWTDNPPPNLLPAGDPT